MFGMSPGKTDMILAAFVVLLVALMVYNHWKAAKPESTQSAAIDIDIKDLIVGVKTALGNIEQERIAKKEGPFFEVKDFDLELNFVVKKTSTATGGIEAKVIMLGSESQYSQENVQKIKLHLSTLPAKEETARPGPAEPPQVKETDVGPVPPPKTTP